MGISMPASGSQTIYQENSAPSTVPVEGALMPSSNRSEATGENSRAPDSHEPSRSAMNVAKSCSSVPP